MPLLSKVSSKPLLFHFPIPHSHHPFFVPFKPRYPATSVRVPQPRYCAMPCCISGVSLSLMKPAIAPPCRWFAAPMYSFTHVATLTTSGKSSFASGLHVFNGVNDMPKPMSSTSASAMSSSPAPAVTTGGLASSERRMRHVFPQPLTNLCAKACESQSVFVSETTATFLSTGRASFSVSLRTKGG